MSERQKQAEFLWEMMRSHDCEKCRELQTRITNAERDERCVRGAIGLALLLKLFSIIGLGYLAIFLPEFFHNNTPVSVKAFQAIFMASGICVVAFLGLWSWYRAILNALYSESREFIVSRQLAKAGADPYLTQRPSVVERREASPEPQYATVSLG